MQRNDSTRTVVGDDNAGKDKSGDNTYPPRNRLQRTKNPAATSNPRINLPDVHNTKQRYPPHIPSVPPFLQTVLGLARKKLGRYSVAQCAVLLVYALVMVVAVFYKDVGPFVDSTRVAWVATSQVPLLILLGAKGGNVVSWIVGYGYEKINFLHRFVGRVVIILANLHGVFYCESLFIFHFGRQYADST